MTKHPWWCKSNCRAVRLSLNTNETLAGYIDRGTRVVDPPEKKNERGIEDVLVNDIDL